MRTEAPLSAAAAARAGDAVLTPDLLPCAALLSDAQGRLLAVNPALVDLVGGSRAHWCGCSLDDLLPPAGRIFLQTHVWPLLLRQDRVQEVHLQLRDVRGERVPVLLNARRVPADAAAAGHERYAWSIFLARERQRFEVELQTARQRLQSLVDSTGAGTWEWQPGGDELRVNARWAQMLGWSPAELPALTRGQLLAWRHPDDGPAADALPQAHLEGRADGYAAELRLRHRDGHWVWVQERGSVVLRDGTGRPQWMYGILIDIGELRRQQQDSRRNEALLDRTGELAGIGGWEYDVAEARLHVTRQTCRILGLDGTRPPGRRQIWAPWPAPARHALQAALRRALREGTPWDLELPLAPPGVLATWVRVVGRAERAEGAETRPGAPVLRLVGAVQDIGAQVHERTRLRSLAAQMHQRATHDALTGLVNRAEFELRLQRALAQVREAGARHALLFLDLDQFKRVNDACGHAAGDRLLLQVTELLRRVVRQRDTLARLGGDEFALILEHCGPSQAGRVATTICEQLDRFRFVDGEQRFRIGVSIGLLPLAEHDADAAAALQAADAACHAAKEAGRNRVHVWHDSDALLHAHQGRLQWALRLERALDEDGFELHGQHIHALQRRRGASAPTHHVEVLLRLPTADGSCVAPGAFLPAAERFHLAARIDRWVLTRALALLQRLGPRAAAFRPRPRAPAGALRLGVNLSGQSVSDQAFQQTTLARLEAAGPSICRHLCLEITETVALANLSEAADFVDRLRALGVQVALDDFGAGSASFGYLKRLKVDLLKIDGQFVRDLLDDALDAAAVRSFVEVARVIGVPTVAEWVECEPVREGLGRLGVSLGQGWLLHRPEPLDRLLGLVAGGPARAVSARPARSG